MIHSENQEYMYNVNKEKKLQSHMLILGKDYVIKYFMNNCKNPVES